MVPGGIGELYSLTNKQKDELEKSNAFASWYQGQRFTNDDPLRIQSEEPVATCTCRVKRYDMENEQDREEYADTMATIISRGWQVTWEERLKKEDKLIIYVSYVETDYVTEKTIEELGLGRADENKSRSLESLLAPGFVKVDKNDDRVV